MNFVLFILFEKATMVSAGKLRPICIDNTPAVVVTLVEWCSEFESDKRASFEQVCNYCNNNTNEALQQAQMMKKEKKEIAIAAPHSTPMMKNEDSQQYNVVVNTTARNDYVTQTPVVPGQWKHASPKSEYEHSETLQ
jgi:hypothetical protein